MYKIFQQTLICLKTSKFQLELFVPGESLAVAPGVVGVELLKMLVLTLAFEIHLFKVACFVIFLNATF